MSSAIGDILQNPQIEGSPAHDQKKAEERALLTKILKLGPVLISQRSLNSKSLLFWIMLKTMTGGVYVSATQ